MPASRRGAASLTESNAACGASSTDHRRRRAGAGATAGVGQSGRTPVILPQELAAIQVAAPLIHPNLTEVCRERVERLHEGLRGTGNAGRGLRTDPLVDRRNPPR